MTAVTGGSGKSGKGFKGGFHFMYGVRRVRVLWYVVHSRDIPSRTGRGAIKFNGKKLPPTVNNVNSQPCTSTSTIVQVTRTKSTKVQISNLKFPIKMPMSLVSKLLPAATGSARDPYCSGPRERITNIRVPRYVCTILIRVGRRLEARVFGRRPF